jgi:hypothetical protein
LEQALDDTAFQVDKQLKEAKRQINYNFVLLAHDLKEIKDNKFYLVLQYDTFESYIAQPELSFDRSSVYRLIQIYETFVLKYNVAPERLSEIEWTKLALVAPHTNKENYEDLLADARELSRSDLREKFTESQECEHEPTEITICRKCRKTL